MLKKLSWRFLLRAYSCRPKSIREFYFQAVHNSFRLFSPAVSPIFSVTFLRNTKSLIKRGLEKKFSNPTDSDGKQFTRRRIEVERYVGHRVIIRKCGQFFVHQYGFAATGTADQHDRMFADHEHVNEKPGSNRLRRVHQCALKVHTWNGRAVLSSVHVVTCNGMSGSSSYLGMICDQGRNSLVSVSM